MVGDYSFLVYLFWAFFFSAADSPDFSKMIIVKMVDLVSPVVTVVTASTVYSTGCRLQKRRAAIKTEATSSMYEAEWYLKDCSVSFIWNQEAFSLAIIFSWDTTANCLFQCRKTRLSAPGRACLILSSTEQWHESWTDTTDVNLLPSDELKCCFDDTILCLISSTLHSTLK